jgi:5'-phosphate synthase pdxT subunit
MEAVAGPGGIGVLDLQGGVQEHLDHLRRIGVSARPVKRAAELDGLAGLILPGGERPACRGCWISSACAR